jgi:cell division protein FtsZ
MPEQQLKFTLEDISVQVESNPDIGDKKAKITLIGIGGGGCNMIDNYCEKNKYMIKIIAANTDNQVLKESIAPIKIQLGPKLCEGRGAGMNPSVGEQSAHESFKEIKQHLEGSDMVFVCAGLGGGTGSGAAPVIAQLAQEMGILTMAVVTFPFSFESGRESIAQDALQKIQSYADSTMVIYNDKIFDMVPKHTGMRESYEIIDDVLFDAVHGVCEMILQYQRKNENVDFNDIATTLTKKGRALIGVGHQAGMGSGIEAVKDAIDSPLLNIDSIEGAKTVLILIKTNSNYSMHEHRDLMDYIKKSAHLGAKCIKGTFWDDSIPKDEAKVTIIATGFESEEPKDDKLQEISTIKDKQNEQIQEEDTSAWGNFKKQMKEWF